MIVIEARNVNDALPMGLAELKRFGVRRESRNGPVTVASCPVTTVYLKPEQRVLFSAKRDANPFFHLVESVWMMAGRNDVQYPASFAKQIGAFSDDGVTLHGAYGYRWRRWFGYDQLPVIIEELKRNPESRRCVLSMWDGSEARTKAGQTDAWLEPSDLHVAMMGGKDVPCNTHIYFAISPGGRLDMTVCNRSNDMVWGAYGANAVHMSFLQEFIARAVGVPVGTYYQMSNNFHMYDFNAKLADDEVTDYYNQPSNIPYAVYPYPIMEDGADYSTWLEDAEMFIGEGLRQGCRHPWFQQVLWPVVNAHAAFRKKDYEAALDIISQCRAGDWRIACEQWLIRRRTKAREKERA